MNSGAYALEGNAELAPADLARLALDRSAPRRARRLGRVRIPLALAVRPWATAYRLPDGRTIWCLRVWTVDRPRTRCVGTDVLVDYCRRSGLPRVAAEIAEVGRR